MSVYLRLEKRNINSFRYAGDIALIVKRSESSTNKPQKEHHEKMGLKLNLNKR